MLYRAEQEIEKKGERERMRKGKIVIDKEKEDKKAKKR